MDVQTLLRLDADLKDFVDDIFVSLRRKGWQERCFCYLTGLMLDGRRKSVQPMAQRLDEPNEQSLHHFVANTPWDPVPVRQRLARRIQQVIDPSAWVFDDTGSVLGETGVIEHVCLWVDRVGRPSGHVGPYLLVVPRRVRDELLQPLVVHAEAFGHRLY